MTEIMNVSLNGTVKPEIDHITESRNKENSARSLLPHSHNDRAALPRFLRRMDPEKAKRILEKYDVRPTRNYRYKGLYGTAFVQRDKNGVVRNIKEVAYGPDGRRVRDGTECQVWDGRGQRYISNIGGYDGADIPTARLRAKAIMWDYSYTGRQCFFGEDQLAKESDKPVMITESEKSALIGAMFHPEFVWIATGGKYGCRWYDPVVFEPLKGRKVYLCPDLGAEEEWQSGAEAMAAEGIDVWMFSLEKAGFVTEEDRVNGLDIADYLVRAWELEHPELAAEEEPEEPTYTHTSTVKQASVPAILERLSKLAPATPATPAPSLEETYSIDLTEIDKEKSRKFLSLEDKDTSTAAPVATQPIWNTPPNGTDGGPGGQSLEAEFDIDLSHIK